MALAIEHIDKPSQATWVAKANVYPVGKVEFHEVTQQQSEAAGMHGVQVAWYEDSIKVTIFGAGPMLLRQMYGTGVDKNVIVEVVPSS